MPESKHACADCAHYNRRRESESWELDHIFWYEHSCFARPGISNLKQFPFYNTTCPSFTWSLSMTKRDPAFRYPPQRKPSPPKSKIDWIFFFTLLFLVFTGAGFISFLVWLARAALEGML